MGDYANYGRDLLGAIGILYVIASVVALVLALWLPKSLSVKMFMAGMVIVLVSILPIQVIQEIRVQRGKSSEFKQRCEKTRALFDERCKTAGEKIYRTVEEVESIALVNLKKKRDSEWEFEQFYPDDLYSKDDLSAGSGAIGISGVHGFEEPDSYIRSFL